MQINFLIILFNLCSKFIETMKSELKSFCVKTLLIILALSFVLFGVVNFFAGVGNSNIAKIGDEKISALKFSRYLSAKRNQYFQSDLTDADLDFINSREFVNISLSEFMGEMLFQNEVKKLNLEEPKEAVLYEITNNPTFQTKSGEFDVKMFKNLLSQNNLNENTYIKYLSLFNSKNNLIGLLISNNLVNNFALNRIFDSMNKYIVADVVKINSKDIKFKVKEPTNADIEKYYNDHKNDFVVPEEKIISSVEIDLGKYNKEEAKNQLSNFEDSVANAGDIDDLAKSFGVKKNTVSYSDLSTNIPDDLTVDILQQNEKTFSKVIYKDNNIYKVYYIEKILPSRTLDLKEARNDVVKILKQNSKEEYGMFFVEKIITQMKHNDIEKVATRNGAKLFKNQDIYIDNKDFSDELVSELYELKAKNFTKPVYDRDNDVYYIGYVKSIKKIPSKNERFITKNVVESNFNNSYSNSVVKMFEDYLIESGNVIINQKVLNSIQ